MSDVRLTQAPILAPTAAPGEARLTQADALAVDRGPANARLTQAAVLALTHERAEFGQLTQTPVLALVDFARDARLTQMAVLVLGDFVPCITHWTSCWRLARTDGAVFTFTALDTPVMFRGEVYTPCNSLAASATELAAMLGSVGNMELTGLISDDAISEEDLFGGRFDRCAIEVWMVPWQNAGGEVPWRLAAGTAGTISHGNRGFAMEVFTPGAMLQQQALIQTYTPSCRWDLGDSRCAVNLVPLTVTGTVTAAMPKHAPNAAHKRIFVDAGRSEAHGYFDLGTLTWTSGANAGARSEVKAFDAAAKRFVLWQPMIHPIQAGDTYEVFPGCDLLASTCKAKFNNYINFGGFDKIPGLDDVTKTPDAKS